MRFPLLDSGSVVQAFFNDEPITKDSFDEFPCSASFSVGCSMGYYYRYRFEQCKATEKNFEHENVY